jgi:radical SAM protein with 4Fe4S-binding SPASM domain
MATIPAATRALTKERISALAAAGLDQIAFSIDGPDPPSHDAFRGIDGSFRRTLLGATYAHEASLPLQINTCFTRWNLEHLEAMVELVCNLGVTFWEVFFLVPMGRGSLLEGLAPEQFDDVFSRLWKLSREADFIVKVTEAPHYRRFVAEHEGSRRNGRKVRPRGARAGIGLSPQAVNSGKGFLFIDHLGNLMPSGFLPLVAGNVRSDSLADVYRHSPLFVDLRRPELLKGRCGRCRYASECGGSRARAYAASTDVFADDPSCCYAV